MNPAKNADEPTVLQGFGTALKNNLVSIAVAAVAAVGIIFAVPAAGSEEMPEVRLGTASGPSQAGLPRGLNPTGSSGAGDPWREVNRLTNKKTGKLATWEDRNGGVSNDGTVPIDKAKKQWGPGIVRVLKNIGIIVATEGGAQAAGFWWFITKGDTAIDAARTVGKNAGAASRKILRIGDLTKDEAAALRRIWDGDARSQLPLQTREQLAQLYSSVAKSNPVGSAQSAFNQARADYLLGRGPNPGKDVNGFAERMGLSKFRRQ